MCFVSFLAMRQFSHTDCSLVSFLQKKQYGEPPGERGFETVYS